jgi:hypothetical protein
MGLCFDIGMPLPFVSMNKRKAATPRQHLIFDIDLRYFGTILTNQILIQEEIKIGIIYAIRNFCFITSCHRKKE